MTDTIISRNPGKHFVHPQPSITPSVPPDPKSMGPSHEPICYRRLHPRPSDKQHLRTRPPRVRYSSYTKPRDTEAPSEELHDLTDKGHNIPQRTRTHSLCTGWRSRSTPLRRRETPYTLLQLPRGSFTSTSSISRGPALYQTTTEVRLSLRPDVV